jgi:hypothetical protein
MLLPTRLLRLLLLGGLFGGGRRRGYGYGYGRRRRGRAGFLGPFPSYTTRTRRGSRVTVSGCCLPIPLALTLALGLGTRRLIRR